MVLISTRQKLPKLVGTNILAPNFQNIYGAQIDELLPADKIGDSPIE